MVGLTSVTNHLWNHFWFFEQDQISRLRTFLTCKMRAWAFSTQVLPCWSQVPGENKQQEYFLYREKNDSQVSQGQIWAQGLPKYPDSD